ncbi:MAG: hypothetical protein ACLSB9_36650 [Hydrogeniiclostridium mannosilyticum]
MKRLLPLLLALVLVITTIVPAYATGDGNFDGGGGSMGDGTKTNYWNPGMDGESVCIQRTVRLSYNRFDLTARYFQQDLLTLKGEQPSYNTGNPSPPKLETTYINPSQSLPKIISTRSSKATSLPSEAISLMNRLSVPLLIRRMDFDTLIGGDYKLVVEPLTYSLQRPTVRHDRHEAALYDQVVNAISERSWERSPQESAGDFSGGSGSRLHQVRAAAREGVQRRHYLLVSALSALTR